MEAYRLRTLIEMLQNLVLKKLTEASGGYFCFDSYFIEELYNFYTSNSSFDLPEYLYIDPFTFHACFDSNHPDITFQNESYWYKGMVEIKFNPRFFGFFNTHPS